ncbi:MAG: VanZ family protein [Clostridia bacterium]|nr:VanZ family protein [Clostridia bacterium]
MSYCVYPQLFFIVAASVAYIWLNIRSRGKKQTAKFANTCAILLVIYATVLLYLALMSRDTAKRCFHTTLFWSYASVLTEYNTFDMLEQIFENILVFIPLGILFPEALNLRNKRFAALLSVGAGALLSLVIELGQFTYAIGCTEIDDLFNNTLGCAIGFGIFSFAGNINVDGSGVHIKKGAFKDLLPATIAGFGALLIILYREIILY